MSIFERIDPDHPLTVATREINEEAKKTSIEAVVKDRLDGSVSLEQLCYLGEQRAIWAAAIRLFGEEILESDLTAEFAARMTVETDWWKENREVLIILWIEAAIAGWAGRDIAGW